MFWNHFSFLSLLKPATLTAAVSGAGAGSATSEDVAVGMFLAVFAVIFIVLCVLVVLTIVSQWKVYKKAGVPGWAALVPFYSNVRLLEITNEPFYWIFLAFIPIVNIFIWIKVAYRLALAFGKGKWFTAGILLLPFIFYPILAFGKSEYQNTFPPRKELTEVGKYSLLAAFVGVLFFMLFGTSGNTKTQPLSILAGQYVTDGQYVYYQDTVIAGADPASFTATADYAWDDSSVYYDGKPILHADPATFKLLDDFGMYAKDTNTVYYAGTPFKADPSTFTVFSSTDDTYAKDATYVYIGDKVVKGADVASYTSIGNGYEEDASNVYYSGTRIPGADLKSFVIVTDPNTYDATDKNHTYNYGQIIKAK